MLTLIKNADLFAPEPLGSGTCCWGGKNSACRQGNPDFDTSLVSDTVDMQGHRSAPA